MTCGYRADGLRAWKQSNGVKTYYLYDGTDPVCELNSSGQTTAINTFGPAGLISRDDSIATYYAYDEHGNVAQRVNNSGTVLSTDLYDAYGKKLSGPASNWGFGAQSGYLTDPETGLLLLTHRYYDPQAGRFLTRDPAGYGGGINLYSYTANNPGNEMDPNGTDAGWASGPYGSGGYWGEPPVATKPAHWWRPGGPYYAGVPEHPQGVDIYDNIATAQAQEVLLGPGIKPWFHDEVKTGSTWDYKQWGIHYRPKGSSYGSYQYDDFGNFNFGAAASALGIPLWLAIYEADQAHLTDHSNQAPNPHDHGDDWITKGYKWDQARKSEKFISEQCK